MKRLLYILFTLPLCLNAQNMYNISSIFDNDLAGTARYIGMGGSMSALGADLSTMATNPAGTAMYRSNDFAFTAGLNAKTNKANYEGRVTTSDKLNAFVGNTAMLFSMNYDGDRLKYLNFGLGYRYKNNLTGEFEMSGASNGFSQQFVMRQLYNDSPFDFKNLTSWDYTDLNSSWLPLLAADADAWLGNGNDFITYPGDSLVWPPSDLAYYEETRGGVHVIDFNLSANIMDRLYLGATVSVSNVDCNRYSAYSEIDDVGAIYTIENDLMLKGTGYDLKLGAIYRPFEYSPFKVGVSVHTPTLYYLKEYSWAAITDPDYKTFSTVDSERYGTELFNTTRLSSPWRFNASMSYTFDTYLALNAEYEFAGYSTAEYKGNEYVPLAQNEEIKCNLKSQHTARLGAEINVEGIAVRVGYNYITSPFARDAYKDMCNASVAETSTDYMNRYEKNIVTCGFGFRGKSFYFDVAYMMEAQKADFYPFYDTEYANPAAKVDCINHTAMATVGMRF
ncbi:MAG: hypothetical protein IIV04_00970 [Bacteroidaceae bacterium]|nr:hypothetical protein [Bacteroidaceae bacterium]